MWTPSSPSAALVAAPVAFTETELSPPETAALPVQSAAAVSSRTCADSEPGLNRVVVGAARRRTGNRHSGEWVVVAPATILVHLTSPVLTPTFCAGPVSMLK